MLSNLSNLPWMDFQNVHLKLFHIWKIILFLFPFLLFFLFVVIPSNSDLFNFNFFFTLLLQILFHSTTYYSLMILQSMNNLISFLDFYFFIKLPTHQLPFFYFFLFYYSTCIFNCSSCNFILIIFCNNMSYILIYF
jgi:hypothetical protein